MECGEEEGTESEEMEMEEEDDEMEEVKETAADRQLTWEQIPSYLAR